jgi:hypothetical protein
VAAKGVVKEGDGLVCLTPVLVCIRIAFSPYIVSVVCLIHVLLSEIDNNEEGTENVFDKSLWRVNNNLLNAFHKMLLLIVDGLCTVRSHYHSFSEWF